MKRVAQSFKLQLLFPPAVELTVADDFVLPEREGLHPAVMETHDREAVKAEEASAGGLNPGVIRPTAPGTVKVWTDLFGRVEI